MKTDKVTISPEAWDKLIGINKKIVAFEVLPVVPKEVVKRLREQAAELLQSERFSDVDRMVKNSETGRRKGLRNETNNN